MGASVNDALFCIFINDSLISSSLDLYMQYKMRCFSFNAFDERKALTALTQEFSHNKNCYYFVTSVRVSLFIMYMRSQNKKRVYSIGVSTTISGKTIC